MNLVQQANLFKVRVGELDQYCDAADLRSILAESSFSGFVVAEKHDSGRELRGSSKRPNPSFPVLAAAIAAADSGSPAVPGLPSETALGQIKDFETRRQALKPFIDTLPDTDASKGYALYHYARALVLHDKSAERAREAIAMLRLLTEGTVVAPPGYAIKAAILQSHATHYYLRNPGSARRMYLELLKVPGINDAQRAYLARQTAATYLELMTSGRKATGADARQAMRTLYAQTPARYTTERALIHLMFSETYLEEGNTEAAAQMAQQVAGAYATLPVVTIQARWNEAIALFRQGKKNEARAKFQEIAGLRPGKEACFAQSRPELAEQVLKGMENTND